jgi:hypothetical protein
VDRLADFGAVVRAGKKLLSLENKGMRKKRKRRRRPAVPPQEENASGGTDRLSWQPPFRDVTPGRRKEGNQFFRVLLKNINFF